MPIKIPNNLPATHVLEGENIFVMDADRAYRQDIRPLRILILNLMPLKSVTETQLQGFLDGMASSGRMERLAENLIDAGSAVAGCGGAFACLFMEALADGAVSCGLPRDKANVYAAQMLRGAAALALESGQPFGAMKDAVCSPGGTTIAGVRALEEGGLRAAAMNAVIAAYEKTLALKQ